MEKTFTGQQADSGMGGLMYYNGRYYDPTISRFISADPIITDKYNLQSYNRYAYVMNNPVMLNDPSGYSWLSKSLGLDKKGAPDLFKGISKTLDDFNRNVLQTNLQGAVSSIDTNIAGFQNSLELVRSNTDDFLVNANGGINNAVNGIGKIVGNQIKITQGLFTGRLDKVISKWTYQYPQTQLGHLFTSSMNLLGQVDDVELWDDVAITTYYSKEGGVTIGPYIGLKHGEYRNSYLFYHEYGHYLQSQDYKWAYLTQVGIPSLDSARGGGRHFNRWFERNADNRAEKHFGIENLRDCRDSIESSVCY